MHTCEEGEEVIHVVMIIVLYSLVPEGGEGNSRGVQPGHVVEQPLGWITTHVAKLHNPVKGLFCDYASRIADKREELLWDLRRGVN